VTGTLIKRPHVFEKGDKVYLTTPLTISTPSESEIEEFAFASAVKTKAPNENIGWLSGRYVEAGRGNLNNAMWLSDELALKALTPMLMPVTVMHDPRTAVGTIADCKLIGAESASSRIDTILAIWRHRFPNIWEEAAANIERGEMMQSMECYAPWYCCSECAQQYIKLPQGAERASWCDHLRTNSGRRILGDVCFTGTGLIFGSRGGIGAYTEAYLDHFHDEIAEYHERAHADSTYTPTSRSATTMGLVQIEESELATLRRERDEAKSKVDQLQNDNRELTTKVETAEAAQKKAEDERAQAQKDLKTANDERAAAELKTKRWDALGDGFLAKLGDTSKKVLGELAKTASDEEWETALAEREELAGVKRDEKASTTTTPSNNGGGNGGGGAGGDDKTPSAFSNEEVASFMRSGAASPAGSTPTPDGASSVRSLAKAFSKPKAGAGSEK
jgi:hypothetical protein